MKNLPQCFMKTVRAVTLAMVPLVEEMISFEIKQVGYGALMSGAWTKFSTHYFGMFAIYNVTVKQKVGDKVCKLSIPKHVLLEISLLITNNITYATNFKAEVIYHFIETTLMEYYGVMVE